MLVVTVSDLRFPLADGRLLLVTGMNKIIPGSLIKWLPTQNHIEKISHSF